VNFPIEQFSLCPVAFPLEVEGCYKGQMRTPSILLLLLMAMLIASCQKSASEGVDALKLMSLKSKCREDGEKARLEWKKTYYQDTFSDEPEYAYNPALNTCLWLGEYTGPSADRDESTGKIVPVQTHVRFILDVYTNKTLIEYTEHDGQQIGDVSAMAFNLRKTQLFGQR